MTTMNMEDADTLRARLAKIEQLCRQAQSHNRATMDLDNAIFVAIHQFAGNVLGLIHEDNPLAAPPGSR